MSSQSQSQSQAYSITRCEYDYLCNDEFADDWKETTKVILQKCFSELDIYKFLHLVFSNIKPQEYIKSDQELIKISLERCSKAADELFQYYLINAPKKIRILFNKPSYKTDIQSQVIVFKYILNTFNNHELIGILKHLIHFRSILDLMRK
jgi:hypothetical protein